MYKISAVRPLKKCIIPKCYGHISKTEISCCQFLRLPPNNDLCATKYKYFQNLRFQSSSTVPKLNIFQKAKEKIVNPLRQRKTAKKSGSIAYEKFADTVNYEEFCRFFNLPDTFQSWYLSVELHVWMVILVTKSNNSGLIFRTSLIDAMWHDVEMKLNRSAEMRSTDKKLYMKELPPQFDGALISYDEGILTDDRVLAAAAWRTLFTFNLVHPEILENIVFYIRKQLHYIESSSTENIVMYGTVAFQPLNGVFFKH